MNLEIDQNIFDWLVELLILKPHNGELKLQNNKIALDEKSTRAFEIGHKFMEIL